jgi:uncharacterized protein (DUF488 family)
VRYLFTIGYEGKDVDVFFDLLNEHSITHLLDVRKNAFSMKKVFSKKPLTEEWLRRKITYSHHPALGIESAKRKAVQSIDEYQKLFEEYQATVLRDAGAEQETIVALIKNGCIAALMCFEKDPIMCHRSRLAIAIREQFHGELVVVDL